MGLVNISLRTNFCVGYHRWLSHTQFCGLLHEQCYWVQVDQLPLTPISLAIVWFPNYSIQLNPILLPKNVTKQCKSVHLSKCFSVHGSAPKTVHRIWKASLHRVSWVCFQFHTKVPISGKEKKKKKNHICLTGKG